jgi:hypothetical protein
MKVSSSVISAGVSGPLHLTAMMRAAMAPPMDAFVPGQRSVLAYAPVTAKSERPSANACARIAHLMVMIVSVVE